MARDLSTRMLLRHSSSAAMAESLDGVVAPNFCPNVWGKVQKLPFDQILWLHVCNPHEHEPQSDSRPGGSRVRKTVMLR
jgi:hypothetical protein